MPRVMVVDDDPDIRLLIRFILSVGHIDVVPVPDARDALDMLRAGERVDLVLLDVQMPTFDGWAMLRELRSDPSLGYVPVVLCTVRGTAEDFLRGWEAGCDGYVSKPFDPEDLRREVGRVLGLDPTVREAERLAHVEYLRQELAAGL